MGLFGNTFKPKEVKAALLALDMEEEKCNTNSAFKLIKKDVSKLICDSEKTVISIKEEGFSPNTLVYLLMTNIISEHLVSGRYHTYRGVLSFVGQDLLKLWDYAVNGLHQLGYHDDIESDKDREWIREQIKNVG